MECSLYGIIIKKYYYETYQRQFIHGLFGIVSSNICANKKTSSATTTAPYTDKNTKAAFTTNTTQATTACDNGFTQSSFTQTACFARTTTTTTAS
jgi:hypothetical protein